MLILRPQNLKHEKKTFSRKIPGSYKYWKLSKPPLNGFWETLSKRNKKCGICYNNFALWKIETIVDVKRQKQPPMGFKIFIEMLGKLKITLLAFLFQLLVIKVEAQFSGSQDRKSLTLYETMYVQKSSMFAGSINCGYRDKKSTKNIFVTFSDSRVDEYFSTLKFSKLEK